MDTHILTFYNSSKKCDNYKYNRHIHDEFISVEKFDMHHLLPIETTQELRDIIISVINLCVRISLQGLSARRPWKCDDANMNWIYFGSGMIRRIRSENDVIDIGVLTANHVIYNTDEASRSTVQLYFDGPNNTPTEVQGTCIHSSNANEDRCCFYVAIQDNLKEEVKSHLESFENALKLCKNYSQNRDSDKICVIVSHPHGCYKQVSIGRLVSHNGEEYDHKEQEKYNWPLSYTTATCKGSSGAYVLNMANKNTYVHCGWRSLWNAKKKKEVIYGYSSGTVTQDIFL